MNDIRAGPFTPVTPSDSRWELVKRVAGSSHFRKGPKLQAFLLYVCENAILGRNENVTAQLIGSRVFGRPPEYDSVEDNIVRVEARELRKRLEAYFAGDGRDEPVIIEIPKGSYVPTFNPRVTTVPAEPEEQTTAAEAQPAVPAPTEPGRQKWLVPVLAAAALISALTAIWFATAGTRFGDRAPAPSASDHRCYQDLLGSMGLIANRETLLVLGNPPVVMYYGAETADPPAEPRTVRAPDELIKTFGFALKPADRKLPYHFLAQIHDGFTGIGEAVAAYHIGRLMQTLSRPHRLTESRFLNWDHVQRQDLILLGGPSSNNWTYQEDAKSNFNIVRGTVMNAKPLPGEQKQYLSDATPRGGAAGTEYGVLKMLTSPYGFKTLLLAGINSAGTAGIGEFFASPEKMTAVHKRIRAAAPGKPFPSDWEVLVRIAVRDGVPIETSAIAVRPNAYPAPEALAH